MSDHANERLGERLRALRAEKGGGDWLDVVARARELEPRSKRTRRGWALALVASIIGLALIAAPALGLHEPIFRFFEGEPAPEPVQRSFESLDEQAPTPEWRPGVLKGQTRIVMRAYFADKWHTLSVVPTKYGGLCTQWSGAGGGCDRLGTVPLSISGGLRPFRLPLPEGQRLNPTEMHRLAQEHRRRAPIDYLTGFAHSKWVHAIEIHYEDGEVERPRVVWVSEPINAGFFAYEVPKEHHRPGHRLASVVGLDEDGEVVTADDLGREGLRVPPADALVEKKEKLIELETRRGPAVLWTAPTRYEGSCAWLEFDRKLEPFQRCSPKGYGHDGIAGRFVYRSDTLLYLGSVGLGVASAQFHFADGEVAEISPRQGFLLYNIPETHLTEGQQLREIVFRKKDGSEVTRMEAPKMAPNPACLAPLSHVLSESTCERRVGS